MFAYLFQAENISCDSDGGKNTNDVEIVNHMYLLFN